MADPAIQPIPEEDDSDTTEEEQGDAPMENQNSEMQVEVPQEDHTEEASVLQPEAEHIPVPEPDVIEPWVQ